MIRKAAFALVGLFVIGWTFVPTPYPFPELPLFPPVPDRDLVITVEGADLGKHLFYDERLSADSSIACASCHRQEFAFSGGPDRSSAGINGQLTQRNAMPLFNLLWYDRFFWDGRAGDLEEQILHPVRDPSEMGSTWAEVAQRIGSDHFYQEKFNVIFPGQVIDSSLIANAIAQFLGTLVSYRSKYDRVLAGMDRFTEDELEGFILINDMTKGDCLHCHTTDADALGTKGTFSNNGLDPFSDPGLGGYTNDPRDVGKFKIPSLRNVGLTAPYMHDGRFATLNEVLDFYSEGVHATENVDSKMGLPGRRSPALNEEEKRKIIAFLHTLTDTTFTKDPEFSDPIIKNCR